MAGLHRTNGGGRVDRSRKLRFTFDGRAYEGLAGDTGSGDQVLIMSNGGFGGLHGKLLEALARGN